MVDWTKLPDLGAVALLTVAFATVARRSQMHVSRFWLAGWIMIAIHFAAQAFSPSPGLSGQMADFLALASLAWAGIFFMRASAPNRAQPSSRAILTALLSANTLYIAILSFAPESRWLLTLLAILLGAVPLAISITSHATLVRPMRQVTVGLFLLLSIFLLLFQQRPGNGLNIALNAIMFTIYLGCCFHFLYAFRSLGAGALVTTVGFLAWASVFVIAPGMGACFPAVHVESEVWNLPKYVVAVGMILVLLEQQIEHNKHLALHDDLTGLPNRRLFQDRITSAIERARRTGTRTALLLIDLDRFKQVNDTVGHHVGDQVLRQVAQILLARVRRSDTVARTGGDEFSIILEEPITREDAERVSRSLIDLLHQSLALSGHTIRVGASIGLAMYPEDAVNSDALRVAADLRMYAQKNTTRNLGFEKPIGPQSSRPDELEARNTA